MPTKTTTAVGEAQSFIFDGRTLPEGLDENNWGPAANPDAPNDGTRVLQVPSQTTEKPVDPAQHGPYTTYTARPGDTIIATPNNRGGYAGMSYQVVAGVGLPPDDPALSGPDKQSEYAKSEHEKAHALPSDMPPPDSPEAMDAPKTSRRKKGDDE